MKPEDIETFRRQREQAAKALVSTPLFVAVPVEQLASIYERFVRLNHMGTATVEAWLAMNPEVKELRHAIFAQSDFGALFAGNWLPNDARMEVRERVKAAALQKTPAEV